MGKPKAPASPDPQETAAAQTGTNVQTAIANAYLGNVNQVTPDGKLTFSESGNKFIADPKGAQYWKDAKGNYTNQAPGQGVKGYTAVNGYYVPQYTATTTLSKQQQKIKNQTDAASLNLGTLANTSSAKLNTIMGTPLSLSDLPKGGDASALTSPQYTAYGSGPQLTSSIGDQGKAQTGLPGAGDIQRNVGSAGPVTRSIANAGGIQDQVGDAGAITRSYGTDFSADRQKVEDAMYARVNPQIERDRAAMETSLLNQGVRRGSTAWDNAMDEQNRAINDQRTSITLSAGQEQTRLANLDAQRAGFENAAQQQAYQQNVGSGQFANAAQQQRYGQNSNDAAFENAAQQQQFGQNVEEGRFANDAQAQQFGQNVTAGQFGNAAQQQNYDQAMAAAEFGNTANQTMFQNRNTAAAGNNALADQDFNTQLARLNAENAQRSTGMNEQFALRNQGLNEIIGLTSGAQVNSPNFVNTNMPSIPTTDYAAIVNQDYSNKLGAYNTQMAERNGILGGLFGLGAAGIKASDRRLKRNVRRVGSYRNGLPKYSFQYLGSDKRFIGLMSDDVRKVRPDAVVSIDGFDAVNYRKALA